MNLVKQIGFLFLLILFTFLLLLLSKVYFESLLPPKTTVQWILFFVLMPLHPIIFFLPLAAFPASIAIIRVNKINWFVLFTAYLCIVFIRLSIPAFLFGDYINIIQLIPLGVFLIYIIVRKKTDFK